ncbi:MAG: hypothetical protein LAP21_02930 [Acidobacteriia bacterium]|nr:hypothetical protein [Terriglobia bacterium]
MTSNEFEKLLRLLDADRERAGEKYEDFRRRLVRFFAWNDCYPEEDLADIVFDRVAHKPDAYRVNNIDGFIWGVANNVKREFYKRRHPLNIEDLPPDQAPQTGHLELLMIDEAERRRQRHCLQECIQKLVDSDRDLFLEYEYYAQTSRKVEIMAESLNLTPGALRVKAHRIKRRVEVCVMDCLHGPRKTQVTQ